MRRFLRLKVSVPLALVAALGVGYSLISVADYTPGTYLDAQTFIVVPRMRRLGAANVACGGLCRTAQAGGANPQLCILHEPNQASFAACLTLLNTDCTPQAVINCASGERQ